MSGLPQGETGLARGDDEAAGGVLIHAGILVVLRGWRLLLAILAWLSLPAAAGGGLPPARNLAADAHLLQAQGSVLLLLFARDGCRWCERARREVLLPLQEEARTRRLLLREIDVDSDAPLIDFTGRPTTQRRFAAAAGVRLTPTLMVFGPDGGRLPEPLVGFLTADFYAEYVERTLEEARRRLASPSAGH